MPQPRARRSTRSRSSLSNAGVEPEEENQELSQPQAAQPVPNDESVVNGKRRRVASAKQGSISEYSPNFIGFQH
jgi:hypothetical protein